MISITGLCVTYGRPQNLRETLACFLRQDYEGPKQLLILNTFPGQTLVGDFPNVKIVNLKERPASHADARNIAIENADGDYLITVDDDDHFCPNCFSTYAEAFSKTDTEWVRIIPVLFAEKWQGKKMFTTWANCVGFSRRAWEKIGGYKQGLSVGEDRNFVSRLSESCNGGTVELAPEKVIMAYSWNNGVFHLSGMGDDREGLAPAYDRSRVDLERRVSNGFEPTGVIQLTPQLEHDPVIMLSDFLKAQEHRRSKKKSIAIVLLGKHGDIINALPLALHIHNSYAKPHFIVSSQYASVLDGVSYVTPHVTDLRHEQLHEAIAAAKQEFDQVIVGMIWAQNWHQERLTDAYNKESWRVCGFLPQFDNSSWQPLFDQQDRPRAEAALQKARLSGKPLIVTNLTRSTSSPFAEGPALLGHIRVDCPSYEVIDVGTLELERIYDLLPFIEAAAAVVTIDTSLLHLAAATDTPVVALVNPQPWLGTIPRCHAVARMTYDMVRHNPMLIQIAIEQAIQSPPIPFQPIAKATPPERQIFHAVSVYEGRHAERHRKQRARDSWQAMYDRGVIAKTFTNPSRTLSHANGGGVLPFLKDVLQPALASAEPKDIIFYSNDDIICHPDLPEQLRYYCSIWGCVASRRCEFGENPPGPGATPQEWVAQCRNEELSHYGRDLFGFTKEWITSVWNELPDFVIGATDWDNCLTAIMRRSCGYPTDCASLRHLIWPAEMPLGWTGHISHHSPWMTQGNLYHSQANIYNRSLFRTWAEKYEPRLKFNEQNVIYA